MDDNQSTNDQQANTQGQPQVKRVIVNDITPPPAPAPKPADTDVQSDSSENIVVIEESASDGMAFEDTQMQYGEGETNDDGVDSTQAEVAAETASVEQDQPEMEHTEQAEIAPEEEVTVEQVEEQPNIESDVVAAPEESTENTAQDETSAVEQSDAPQMPAQQEVVMGVAASQLATAGKQTHHNNKKFAVLVTVLTAVLLAGIAVYVYISANNNAKGTTATNAQESTAQVASESETVAPATPATAADVDQTIAELDQAVDELDDAADLNENDLSDKTLGL